MYSVQKLEYNLVSLGIKKGDTLLVRADLGAIGKIDTRNREDYINCMLNAVGVEGTIVGLSFTNSFSIFNKNKNVIFERNSKTYTGAFSNTMLKFKNSLRSSHPTNSYVAIGKYAEYILKEHDETSGAYEPIRKLMELNAKMILIGCVESSPGFTTTHLAEVDLGLHKRIIFPTLSASYYKNKGELKIFRRKDLGSCSSTFYKFYGFYVRKKLLKQGYVGNAYSILIDAEKAYSLDYEILKAEPKITICNNPSCKLCRMRRWDNMYDIPKYAISMLVKKIKKKIDNDKS
jgi:aminoglycoside N3'-acetyltransferase